LKKRKTEKILAAFALITIVIAGILGYYREAGQLETEINSVYPEASQAGAQTYISIESAQGYGGDLVMAIQVDSLGTIKDLKIVRQRETPSFLKKVIKGGLLKELTGISYSYLFRKGEEIDYVTGATYTSRAIVECARQGAGNMARDKLGFEVPAEEKAGFSIGIPEIALVLLYLLALIGVYSNTRFKKVFRWVSLTTSLIVLGFWFSVPLTLSRINLFLLGFWPDWHEHFYWYILVFGFFLVLLTTRKNIYCTWICPLGCIQDGLGLVGGARPRFSRKFNLAKTWIQRGIAWLAIILALYFRNPVQLNYEIFGVSLSLTGATYLFIMTGVFLIASLFISRPWCNYLCPITPVADLLRMLRINLLNHESLPDQVFLITAGAKVGLVFHTFQFPVLCIRIVPLYFIKGAG
jgi:uncharacterized protein with FMN-binding domain